MTTENQENTSKRAARAASCRTRMYVNVDMVNINIEIPDDLHKQLRLDSIQQDSTLKDQIIQLLEEEVQ